MPPRSLVVVAAAIVAASPLHAAGWTQRGAGPAHEGSSEATGQALSTTLAQIQYDPFAHEEEQSRGNGLLVHYQAPLADGGEVVMTFKTGAFTTNADWGTQTWNVKLLRWGPGGLEPAWAAESDWKPEPQSVAGWEPVFHPAMTAEVVYVPGAGGTLLRYQRSDGAPLGRVNPFGPAPDPAIYVAGPLTIDAVGNVYYDAIKLDSASPSGVNPPGPWLVRI